MESQGLVSDESWSSFDLTTVVDESEVMMHLFGAHQYLHEQEQEKSGIATQPMFWTDHSADNSYYYSENTNCNPYFSTSDSSNFLHNISNFEGYYSNDAGVNFSNADEQTTQTSMPPFPVSSCHRFTEAVMNEETSNDGIAHSISDQSSQSMKRMLHNDYADKSAAQAQRDDIQFGSPKKKTCRASVQVSKKGKNVQFKKQKKSASGYNDADSNPDMNGQSSCCYSSEDDDSNASQDTKRAGTSSISSKGKTRADRGSATDPQSLYARKRRERINERLRILQTLVPNGTKVDISTMLEEAVQYVKFLQLQIKLLSSDEMWMYAPIAYNGMNLGFDLKVPAPSASSKRS